MEVVITRWDDRHLAVSLKGFIAEDIAFIKRIPGRRWLPDEKVWRIPFRKEVVNSLVTRFPEGQFSIDPDLTDIQELYGKSPDR
ncbi:hypothetical protein GNP94_23740 [Paenibacillus campinasensis]|uniref:Uncharacterized protein n=1 Tax=Paenibacillus campinasensis TaxID=66347 RepID=A0ABW9TBI2_9BACL|nr:hypothetical protein [Paenibacillus campinasensis]MUG68971.1 hypothetical protein [Paenibacillus campinasensis]